MTPSTRTLKLLATLWVAGCALAAGHHPARKARGARPPVQVPLAPGAIVNVPALAPFLGALDSGSSGVVRILQFGDSHTAADFWSGRVRQRLQARFGDGGPGCILPGRPWRGYPHTGVRLVNGQGWPAQSLRSGECDGRVGLTGASLTPVAGEAFTVQAAFGSYRVQLLGPDVEGITVDLGGETPASAFVPRASRESLGEGVSLQTFQGAVPADGAVRSLSLLLPQESRLLGVELLSGHPGVVYDELGLNGAELTDLERWDPGLRRTLLRQAHPDLLVLAYGTNDMGKAPGDRPDYEVRVRALLAALKAESGAPILVVGPLDRLGRKARQRGPLKAGAQWVIQALKGACLQEGCAFWDARQAMGGYGAIQRWRKAGLAQKDLVHLNSAGYQRLGDLLADALLAARARS